MNTSTGSSQNFGDFKSMEDEEMMTRSWVLDVGNRSKESLLFQLSHHKVNLNAYAAMILMSENFSNGSTGQQVTVIEVSLRNLGFEEGAVFSEITDAASSLGFELCPIELAPYLRLQYLDQPLDSKVTIASNRPFPSEEYPKGFYLGHSNGCLWLRGYRASDDWEWFPEHRFVFVKR